MNQRALDSAVPPNTDTVTAYGSLMGEHWYLPPGNEVVNRYFYTRNERLPQYLTEDVLRGKLAQLPSVTTMFGRTAMVQLLVAHGADKELRDSRGLTVLEMARRIGNEEALPFLQAQAQA